MRLAWVSNSPLAPTGYGGQTKQVCRRLRDAGHDVHILSNYGHVSGTGIQVWEDIPVWPQGVTQYSVDILGPSIAAVDPDFVITLYDVWVMKGANFPTPSVSWVPIDHYPASPEVVEWLKGEDTPESNPRPAIAMSEYGQAALAEAGISAGFIPHAIDTKETFKPRERGAFRERANIPNDVFLIGMNAANIGRFPPRKMFVEQFMAIAEMMARHDDVWFYIHTDLNRPNGVDLSTWMLATGVDKERVRAVDPLVYRVGLTGDDDLAHIYSDLDVFTLCSGGEGFGIPVVESMACGSPAIVTDFSAQPELVGDTGWKVGYQLTPDYGQGAFLATPRVESILTALEEAYGEKDTDAADKRSRAVRERATRYDADTVFEEAWKPLLAQMETADQKAKAAQAGLVLPPAAGQLTRPDGTPLFPRPNRKQRRAANKRKGRK
jgi:glycosyltransferase involved in cell wall biosynthesis